MKTEELDSRVKELNDYFVGKLVTGEYDVEERDRFIVMVNIDGYKFIIWIANGRSHVQTYGQGIERNFMELVFNMDQKSTIYENLMQDKSASTYLMAEIKNKEMEIEQLKSKLSKL